MSASRASITGMLAHATGLLHGPRAGHTLVVCAPLWAGERILGAVLLDRDGVVFDERDLELLASVGNLLGLGLERERLASQVLDSERCRRSPSACKGSCRGSGGDSTVGRGLP